MFFVALLVCAGSTAQDFRWTKMTHERVKVKRGTDPDMAEVMQGLSDLAYTGDISTAAQEEIWYATTQGEMMQYATPSRNRPVKLK